ncbi:MAG: BamA/TamA family outer membrane protein [Lewinellaceae bacterium]|nr:BamA/TamA family outer membrane protein [Lewinellaceae bacterium]
MTYNRTGCDKKGCALFRRHSGRRGFLSAPSGIRFCFLLLLASLLGACNVTKHLDQSKGERLLVRNSVELKSDKRLKYSRKTALQYELAALFKQQPNRRPWVLFRQPTRLWFYYRHRDKTTKFSKWIMEKVAEPPAIFSERLTQLTAQNFENQMQQRGYLLADCSYELIDRSHHFSPVDDIYFNASKDSLLREAQVKVKYTVNLGPLFTIDTVRFYSPDGPVDSILHLTAGKSALKRGDPLDGHAFDVEKLRITNELKNRGYAYFTPNFVSFTGDSTNTRTNVTVEVLTPGDSVFHKTYHIGNIEVFSSVRPEIMAIRNDTVIGGINFRSANTQFRVKPGRLYRSIELTPGALYRQEDFDNTIRNLNALGVFRFVSVKPKQDTVNSDNINVEMLVTPNKRISLGADVDLNSSTSSSAVARNLLGVSTSLTFRNRNLFRGAENLQSNAQYNIEFDVATRNRFIFSQEFKLQNQIVFPRFFDYLGLWKLYGRFEKNKDEEKNTFYHNLRNQGQARLSLNYNHLDLIDFYVYNLFNASFGYDLRVAEHQFSFDHVGIDILRPRIRSRFDSIFGQNEFLQRSFNKQLFTGFILRAFNYYYTGTNNRFGERWYYHLNTDLSGLEELALNRLWSAAFGKQTWTISDLDFAQFFRVDMDGVYTRDFRKTLTGVLRMGAGVAIPFGDSPTVPYVKQFFVGGPASIRAWRIREIGPGGYVPRDAEGNIAPLTSQPFFQAGDFRFEFNAELRFDIFSWFKGAIFVDGGNIWTLKNDADRPGSQLRWDSYKNIALGTGFGIRGDFSYLIIRFDAGLKLRNPYADDDGKFWIPNRLSKLQPRDFNPNLAVGLPF